MGLTAESILAFWFEEIDPKSWWKGDADFDALIRERFLDCLERAALGELYSWRSSARAAPWVTGSRGTRLARA